MSRFLDIANLSENKRIKIIGEALMKCSQSSTEKPVMAAFVVEDNEKADRYIKKLQEKFPGVRVIDRFTGPVANTVTVRMGAPLR